MNVQGFLTSTALIAAAAMLHPQSANAQVFRPDCGIHNRCADVDRRPGLRDGPRDHVIDGPVRGVPAHRARGYLVGHRFAPARIGWVARPSVYGLAPLRPGFAYARWGRDIYVVERETGVIIALALVVAATR